MRLGGQFNTQLAAFAKVAKTFSVLACSALLSAGCNVAVQDPAQPQIAFKIDGPKCLSRAATTAQAFFEATAGAEDVNSAWDCADQSVATFLQRARGSDANVYTALEIRTFLHENFLDTNTRINDRLLTEIMRVKRLLLGGSSENFSRSELQRLQQMLQVLKSESIRVLPYMSLIMLKASPSDVQKDPEQVEGAIGALQAAVDRLHTLLSHSNETYELDHLRALMEELKTIYSTGGRQWDGPEFVIQKLSAIGALKAFVIKPAPDKIAPDEWSPLLKRSARLFSLYIRTHFLLQGRDVLNGEGLDQLAVTVYSLFDEVEAAIQAKPNKIIAYAQVDALVTEILRTGFLTWPVRATTMTGLVHVAMEKVFNPPVGGRRPAVTGLSLPIFNRAKDGIFGWIDMQRVWREVVIKAIERNPAQRGRPLPISVVKSIWPTIRTPYRAPHGDLNALFNRTYPMILNNEGMVQFDPLAGNLVGISQQAFDAINWRSHFARIVNLGWATNPSDPFTGLLKTEFHAFYDDARELAKDLKFIEPDDATLWDTTFDESNMFGLGSVANDRLSYSEGVDFISYAMSSAHILGPLYDDVKANCAHQGVDAYGRPKVNYDCFNARAAASFPTIYRWIPSWERLSRAIGVAATRELLVQLEVASRSKTARPGDPISLGDINRVTMLIHYIESIYTRFDDDQNGALNLSEAAEIYPIFHDILKKAAAESGITAENEIYALYAYILLHGHPPQTWLEKLDFKTTWMWDQGRWNAINANRVLLVRIVGQLAARR